MLTIEELHAHIEGFVDAFPDGKDLVIKTEAGFVHETETTTSVEMRGGKKIVTERVVTTDVPKYDYVRIPYKNLEGLSWSTLAVLGHPKYRRGH